MNSFHLTLKRKVDTFFTQKLRVPRLETGFSMLEAVVVVGVLLALAVGGFVAYGPITENAKKAKVKSAASEVYTAVMVASIDGDIATEPQDVIDAYNSSNNEIKVEILDSLDDFAAMTTAAKPLANGDFCIQATNIKIPKIKERIGSCSDLTEGSTPIPDDDTTSPLPAVSTARLKFGVAEPGGSLTSEVDDVARLMDEYPGYVMLYKDFSQPLNEAELDAIYDKGSQPIVTWEPFVAGAGVTQPDYELKDIIAGNHDARIDNWINSIKLTNYDKPILIRFAHEMNGHWYPWAQNATSGVGGAGPTNGNGDWEYVNAWKHVHDRFTAAGVQDKVDWIWSPNVPYDGSTEFGLVYPGDDYVDIVGLDGFNFGTTDQYSTWKAPWEVLGAGLWHARDVPTNKPIIITETASVPSEGANSQSQWVNDLVYWLNNDPQNQDVIGFVWFDQIKRDEIDLGQISETNWRLDANPETSLAMKTSLAQRR
jgi:type II secretory pathway pseudopilin PulG